MDSDLQLAIKLHNELNNSSPEVPAKRKKFDGNKSKSQGIVDPEWEITDPNPDIYTLFQVFDKKYFWGKLDCVEVKWSPRMYSCAGICTYKGKWGGCIISLSLPLLKLRPRKDLIETLLHEMIHAYLFVADKNRDRGEHGPKFHEHMFRINKEAGTKITVYHTFHDEVKHYKQHWWRCNGPCQNQKPFFGLVKRSMNRAPGPNDFWFADHQTRCGGEFMKIKEPDGFKSRKRGADKTVEKPKNKKQAPANSLEKYFPGQKESSPANNDDDWKKPLPKPKPRTVKVPKRKIDFSPVLKKYFSDNLNKNEPAVKKIKSNNSSPKIENYKKISNIHEITKPSKSNVPSANNLSSTKKKVIGGSSVNTPSSIKGKKIGGSGVKSNMSGTLIINPKASTIANSPKKNNIPNKTPPKSVFVPFSGTGHQLGGGSSGAIPDRSKSKLLSLYSNSVSSPPVSLDLPSTSGCSSSKEIKSDLKPDDVGLVSDSADTCVVSDSAEICPASDSADVCVASDSADVCVASDSADVCVVSDSDDVYSVSDSEEDEQSVHCPVCNEAMSEAVINDHLECCTKLESVFESTASVKDDEEEGENPDLPQESPSDEIQCPVCSQPSTLQEINQHLDNCLG